MGKKRWYNILERNFQSNLIKEIERRLPGSIVLKNDPNYKQGIPDLTIFYKDRWATLEVKASSSASERPNQEYYVELMSKMSFSSFIDPSNKEEVLYELERALKS